jgi:primosomal protein N' (replication factor Y)
VKNETAGSALATDSDVARVVRVQPDVAALHRSFDYAVPETWRVANDIELRVGSRVRVELHGRRVGGWVTELDPEPVADVELRLLQKWSGMGPAGAMIDLANWLSYRWVGSPAKALRTASPRKNVYRLPAASTSRWNGDVDPAAALAFDGAGSVMRVAPGADRWPLVLAAAALGNPLLLMPTIDAAQQLAARLRRIGLDVALLPEDWARAAAGAVVVGTRAAILGPVGNIGAVVVFDEHDQAYREERTPTWHAREVAIERARRANVPCVLVSPTPSVEAVVALPLHEPDRSAEHRGWPTIQVVDRRSEPPGRLGLFSEELVRALSGPGRVACVLNRTGRVRLLACVACGELTCCDLCQGAVRQIDDSTLTCSRCGDTRPPVCAACGGARLKNLVLGVSRAREELSALLGEPVGEVTASDSSNANARVVIGTEALLRASPGRNARWTSVAFLDFDQHLTALRQQAESEAIGLLVMAARLVGPRRNGGRVLVQTRMGEHRVLDAARRAEPAALTTALATQADQMRWPPAIAQAEVSGKGAPGFIERLGNPIGLQVLGPNEDRWLIRADDNDTLVTELARVDRGDDRLRLAVH